jgi:cytochrome c peroxidase
MRKRPFDLFPLACIAMIYIASCGDQGHSVSTPTSQMAVAADPQQSKIDLGRMLMFDERLSKPRGVSCGACHDPFIGWGDGRPQGKGIQDHSLAGDTDGDGIADHDSHLAVSGNKFKTILTGRNTPTVYNSHLFPNLFWDGRAGDLGHQAIFPVEGFNEMNSSWETHVIPLLQADPDYPALFLSAFGSTAITDVLAADAIGAYEATISVFDTPYDEYLAGDLTALSPEAISGLAVFRGNGACITCHSEPMLSNFGFANIGVPSAGINALEGTLDFGFGKRTDLTQVPPVTYDTPSDYMKFKVPQLRMVGLTGPYMHNGAIHTLEEVVEFMDQGGGPDLSGTGTKDPAIVPLGLTTQEKSDLVAFLREGLTGNPID